VATGDRSTVTVLDAETHVIGALERHGYRCEDNPYFLSYHSRELDNLTDPSPPKGFVARPIRGEEDLARRVAVHRAGWRSPSRLGIAVKGTFAALGAVKVPLTAHHASEFPIKTRQ
jgi:hypothetical protein